MQAQTAWRAGIYQQGNTVKLLRGDAQSNPMGSSVGHGLSVDAPVKGKWRPQQR